MARPSSIKSKGRMMVMCITRRDAQLKYILKRKRRRQLSTSHEHKKPKGWKYGQIDCFGRRRGGVYGHSRAYRRLWSRLCNWSLLRKRKRRKYKLPAGGRKYAVHLGAECLRHDEHRLHRADRLRGWRCRAEPSH